MMEAKDFLNQLKRIDETIQNKVAEVEQWKSIALGVTGGGNTVTIKGEEQIMERVQSSGSQQKMADAVCKYVDLEKEIDQHIDALFAKREEVLAVLGQLDKPIQYNVLRKRYVQFKNFGKIAEEMCYSYQYILEVHSDALKNVQKILDS